MTSADKAEAFRSATAGLMLRLLSGGAATAPAQGTPPASSGRLPGRAGPEGARIMHQGVRLSGRRRSFVMRPRRRRPVIIAVVVAALVIALGAAGAELPVAAAHRRAARARPRPAYLSAWQRGAYPAMDKVSVNVPRSGLAGPLQQAAAELGVRRLRLVAGPGDRRTAGPPRRSSPPPPSWPAVTPGRYQGQLHLVKQNRHWWVSWSPAAIYPGLRPGERFVLSAAWPARAQVLAADGTVLSSPGGDRRVRLPRAADRQRGRGHRRPGQGARRPVPGRRPDRPGRDRAGLPGGSWRAGRR